MNRTFRKRLNEQVRKLTWYRPKPLWLLLLLFLEAGYILLLLLVVGLPSPPTPSVPKPTLTPLAIDVGRLEITYPEVMKINETDVVSVEIIIDPRLDDIGAFPANATGLISIEERSTYGIRKVYESEIKLYPVMYAELQASSFDYKDTNNGTKGRVISPGEPIGWVWDLVATNPGEHVVSVSIYGERNSDGEEITTLAHSTSLTITVEDKTFIEKTLTGITDNIVAVLGVGGPLGVLLAWLTYRLNKANQELERRNAELVEQNRKFNEQIIGLEQTKIALERRQETLKQPDLRQQVQDVGNIEQHHQELKKQKMELEQRVIELEQRNIKQEHRQRELEKRNEELDEWINALMTERRRANQILHVEDPS